MSRGEPSIQAGWHGLWWLAMALGPLALFFLGNLLSETAKSCDVSFVPVADFATRKAEELVGRYNWTASYVLLLAAAVAGVLVATFVILRSPERGLIAASVAVASAISLAVILYVLGAFGGTSTQRIYDCLGVGFFKNTLGALRVSDKNEQTLLGLLEARLDWANAIVGMSSAFIAVAAASIVAGTARTLRRYGELSQIVTGKAASLFVARELDRGVFHLRLLLFIGSAILVIGVISQSQWMRWPAPFLQTSEAAAPAPSEVPGKGKKNAESIDQRKSYLELVDAQLVGDGATYVLILIGIYCPAAFYLYHRGVKVARGYGQTKREQDEFMSEAGIGLNVGGALMRLGAILGPVLAGPVGSAISTVSKHTMG